MPEARLQRTRDNHASVDPFNSLALIYINHARAMLRQGQKEEARIALVEAARLLGSELAVGPESHANGIVSTPLTRSYDTVFGELKP